VLFERHPEFVMAVLAGDEVQVRDIRRICSRGKTCHTRRCHRSRGQTFMYVGVVRRRDLQILVQHSSHVVAEGVLNGWIGLKQHSLAQPIVVNGGDDRALFRKAGSLDDGSHRHEVVD
jgi:hypothetical protein